MDRISKEHRSWNMSRIKSKDTKPELIVRKQLFKIGYRYRLYGKISKRVYKPGILPGKPDIVLKKYKTVIFINGCFWHQHPNCKYSHIPKTRTEWWQIKLNKNIERDKSNTIKLNQLGWKVITVWECETKKDNINNLSELFIKSFRT